MAIPTTTTATTTTGFGPCAAESKEHPGCVYGFAALYQAFVACCRGKRATGKAQRYEIHLLDHLVDTAQALQQHAWRPSRASRFVVTHPKPREILASPFADRVVHHWLVPHWERQYEPVFIDDSFANRKGKGSHAAVRRLQTFTRAVRGGWFLQLDIANFFNSINRRHLFGLLSARLRRDRRRKPTDHRHVSAQLGHEMLWLSRVLLTGNLAVTARFRGRKSDLARVPAHKQLANAPAEHGLPIGNLTSQFFANVYLNELDQFIKHQLKARHYVRYVDDFVLLHHNPDQLRVWQSVISRFLQDELGLALRDAGQLAPIRNGIDFLGYIIRPDYLLVRRRVVGHLLDRLHRFKYTIVRGPTWLQADPETIDQLQAVLASYLGHFRHAKAGPLIQHVWRRHPWLSHWFEVPGFAREAHLRRTDYRSGARCLRHQWRWVQRRYPQHAILMQVGSRWECAAGPAARRTTRRRGLPPTVTLPPWRLSALRRWLARRRQNWCEIAEHGYLHARLKRRQLVSIHTFPPRQAPLAPLSARSLPCAP